MKAFSIVGLGYGDEGKGATVAALANKYPDAVVIKSSGGCQAAHRVVYGDKEHVFSQFGSGAFSGCPTIIDRDFIICPIALRREAESLATLGGCTDIMLHTHCPITTSYHKAYNRIICLLNKVQNSCGRGIGITRQLVNDGLSLVLSDFADPSRDTVYRNLYAIRGKLLSLLYPFKNQINSNSGGLLGEYLDTLNSPVGVEANLLYTAMDWLRDNEKRIKVSSLKSRTLIFENSQGVLLDETYCLDDYGTYSTVTSRNAADFLAEYDYRELTTIGVARSYLTRHGAGPFLENFSPDSATIDPSNTEGKFQGKFRTGLWTRELWEHTIHAAKPDYLAINHLDVADKPDFMQGEVVIEGYGANILDKKFVKDI